MANEQSLQSILEIEDLTNLIANLLPDEDFVRFACISTKIFRQTFNRRKDILQWNVYLKLLSKKQTNLANLSELLKLFRDIKQNFANSLNFRNIGTIQIFKDYHKVSKTYLDSIQEISRLQLLEKENIAGFSYAMRNRVLMEGVLTLLVCIPPISFGTLIWFLHEQGKDSYYTPKEKYYVALMLFPPLLIYQLGWTIYTAIKLSVKRIIAGHTLEQIEQEADEVKSFLGRVLAHHVDNPNPLVAVIDVNCDPEAIKQRDELFALFLGEKFAGTNSTGIVNIQAQMSAHPNMSCEKCFKLIETEITKRENTFDLVTLFRNINRHDKIKELYYKITGGPFGILPKLQLTTVKADRDNFITFIKANTFVSTRNNLTTPVAFGIKSF
jgi:hypothetical protein